MCIETVCLSKSESHGNVEFAKQLLGGKVKLETKSKVRSALEPGRVAIPAAPVLWKPNKTTMGSRPTLVTWHMQGQQDCVSKRRTETKKT